MISVNDYTKQIDNINYKGEIYSARDNGSVFRYPKSNKIRSLDNQWTFGKQSMRTGYMEIGGERIHRIIATGFLGNAPTKEHVVDHIDTNRANNRPENLRWITKLENVLLNETTAKRISIVCGSVENFLNDPSKYRDKFIDPNISWMCTVSQEEAQTCLNNLKNWSKLDNYSNPKGGKLDKWIYSPLLSKPNNAPKLAPNNIDFINSKQNHNEYHTPNTEQDWSTPTQFPCCPKTITKTPLLDYFNNLKPNSIFGKNRYTSYKVNKTAFCKDFIVVITSDSQKGAIKPWCVNKITFENNIFYHSKIKTCFQYIGAEKYFTIKLQNCQYI